MGPPGPCRLAPAGRTLGQAANSSSRPDASSRPVRTGSPASTIYPISRPQRASRSPQGSRQRVNDLRVLTSGSCLNVNRICPWRVVSKRSIRPHQVCGGHLNADRPPVPDYGQASLQLPGGEVTARCAHLCSPHVPSCSSPFRCCWRERSAVAHSRGVAATSASNARTVGSTGTGKALIKRWNGRTSAHHL